MHCLYPSDTVAVPCSSDVLKIITPTVIHTSSEANPVEVDGENDMDEDSLNNHSDGCEIIPDTQSQRHSRKIKIVDIVLADTLCAMSIKAKALGKRDRVSSPIVATSGRVEVTKPFNKTKPHNKPHDIEKASTRADILLNTSNTVVETKIHQQTDDNQQAANEDTTTDISKGVADHGVF